MRKIIEIDNEKYLMDFDTYKFYKVEEQVIEQIWPDENYEESNYTSDELDNLLYDAFEGEQDAYDEWTQR